MFRKSEALAFHHNRRVSIYTCNEETGKKSFDWNDSGVTHNKNQVVSRMSSFGEKLQQ